MRDENEKNDIFIFHLLHRTHVKLKKMFDKTGVGQLDISGIRKKFTDLHSKEPMIVRSPGRINLIGEHTDYNMGFVLPAAIDKAIYFAIAPSSSRKCKISAVDLADDFEFTINQLEKSEKEWPNYLLGVVDQLKKAGYDLKPFDCIFGGNIPIGAGLSSSAAIEAGLVYALNRLFDLDIDQLTMVKIAQQAENKFVGVQCGIMDQFINIFGKREQVLQIDCRSLNYQYFPFRFHNIDIILCDTQISHSLASSAYNTRRKQCEHGVEILKRSHSQINSLRDVTLEMLKEHKAKMDPLVYMRCHYVVKEILRVQEACNDLLHNDLQSFGEKMRETHIGLRDDYEVSEPFIDLLFDLTLKDEGVLGSRLMGGGFGGCTINLVKKDYTKDFIERIEKVYNEKAPDKLQVYLTSIEDGTSIVEDEG
jgi:galactokinase